MVQIEYIRRFLSALLANGGVYRAAIVSAIEHIRLATQSGLGYAANLPDKPEGTAKDHGTNVDLLLPQGVHGGFLAGEDRGDQADTESAGQAAEQVERAQMSTAVERPRYLTGDGQDRG
jgi:hypothetical protein